MRPSSAGFGNQKRKKIDVGSLTASEESGLAQFACRKTIFSKGEQLRSLMQDRRHPLIAGSLGRCRGFCVLPSLCFDTIGRNVKNHHSCSIELVHCLRLGIDFYHPLLRLLLISLFSFSFSLVV